MSYSISLVLRLAKGFHLMRTIRIVIFCLPSYERMPISYYTKHMRWLDSLRSSNAAPARTADTFLGAILSLSRSVLSWRPRLFGA